VNGTRKQTKKEDKNKLVILAFKIIAIFHNTLLATTKIKFFLGLLPIFVAHQPTHQPQILWTQTQILLWGNLSFWGGSQIQMLLQGLLPILGAHWGLLGFRGSKSNFISGLLLIVGVPNSNLTLGLLPIFWPELKFYSGSLAYFWGPLGPLGVQGLKIKFYFEAFTHR
jgi:hypothetical protein